MEYELDAIPTKFMGVRFRSRLEAKWAAFFQLMQWKWQYEPRDFSGWMPDFGLYEAHRLHPVTYVEVKPITRLDEGVAAEMVNSGCKSHMLLVGENMPPTNEDTPSSDWLGPPRSRITIHPSHIGEPHP